MITTKMMTIIFTSVVLILAVEANSGENQDEGMSTTVMVYSGVAVDMSDGDITRVIFIMC